MRDRKQSFLVYVGTFPKSLLKCLLFFSSSTIVSMHRNMDVVITICTNKTEASLICCGWQDESLATRQWRGAARGSTAPGTRDRPDSTVNCRRPTKATRHSLHTSFLINFQSALRSAPVCWCWPPRSECRSSVPAVRRSTVWSRNPVFYNPGPRGMRPFWLWWFHENSLFISKWNPA